MLGRFGLAYALEVEPATGLNKMFSFFTPLYSGVRITDATCGLKWIGLLDGCENKSR